MFLLIRQFGVYGRKIVGSVLCNEVTEPAFLSDEKHSLGERFRGRLMPQMKTKDLLLLGDRCGRGAAPIIAKGGYSEMNDMNSLTHAT